VVFFIEVGALILAVLILYLLLRVVESPMQIVANAVIGIIVLLIINMFLIQNVAINFFSIAIVALAGIPGVLLVLLLHFLGLTF